MDTFISGMLYPIVKMVLLYGNMSKRIKHPSGAFSIGRGGK